MKSVKMLIIGFVAGLIIATTTGAYASAGDTVQAISAEFNIIVNGKPVMLDQTPIVVDGSSYLPVRSISNALGYDVTYKADSHTIELNNGYKSAAQTSSSGGSVGLGSISAVNGGNVVDVKVLKDYLPNDLDFPAIEVGGTVYLPARQGSEKYSLYPVLWDSDTKTMTFGGSKLSVKMSDEISSSADAFVYRGSTYVKESLLQQASSK